MSSANPKYTVVVGGGIAGLLSAWLLRRATPEVPVLVLEQAPEVGGLLGKVDGGEFGTFDLGMHTMTETGVDELDELLWSLLPAEDWYRFGGAQRDISGTFFQGRLQRHAHYPDLRSLPQEDYQACLVDLLAHLQKPPEPNDRPESDMRAFGRRRFGHEITQRVIEPILQRTYGRSAEQISTLAATLLRLERVVMFEERLFRELMGSPTLRARLAYPEQRNLDLSFSSGRGSYYPKNFGIHRVIDALVERCREIGVEILTSTTVGALEHSANHLDSVRLTGGSDRVVSLERIVWSAGVLPLARQLQVFPQGHPSDPPLTTAVINFLFDHPTEIGDLYYFYCLDEGYRTHRVTNFTAYCPGAPRVGGFPISVELLLPNGHSTDPEVLTQLALKELHDFGVLPPVAQTLFSHASVLERGFPLPSVANMELITTARDAIDELQFDNLDLVGVLSQPGLFYQTDVMLAVYQTLMTERPLAIGNC